MDKEGSRRKNLDDAQRIIGLCRITASPKDVFVFADAVGCYIETGKFPASIGELLSESASNRKIT